MAASGWERSVGRKYLLTALLIGGALVAVERRETASVEVVDVDAPAARQLIGQFLQRWIATVQSRDLPAQMECYAPVVEPFFGLSTAGGEQIRLEKQRLFKRLGPVRKMTIDGLQFQSLTSDRAVVTFRKEWDIGGAGATSGTEDVRLTLRRIANKWKISGEEESNVRWVKR